MFYAQPYREHQLLALAKAYQDQARWHDARADARRAEMAAGATPAVHALRRHGLAFTEHEYRYELQGRHGGVVARTRRATNTTS